MMGSGDHSAAVQAIHHLPAHPVIQAERLNTLAETLHAREPWEGPPATTIFLI